MEPTTKKERILSKAVQAISAQAILEDLKNDLFNDLFDEAEEALELISKLNVDGLHLAIATYIEEEFNS